MISYAVQRRGKGHQHLTSIWRVQLFNYVAFTIAVVSLSIKRHLSPFNQLAALHLTYMNLVSALTGSQLVHPTYLVYNRPSTRTGQRAWDTVVVNIIRVLGGLLPVLVCAFTRFRHCTSLHSQFRKADSLTWITLFGVPVGEQTAYALTLSFACIVLLLHIVLSLVVMPEDVQHFMGLATRRKSRFIAAGGLKQRMNDLAFIAFFVYWLEVVVAIERSLVTNLGHDVISQNDWGFGQVSIVLIDVSTAAYLLFYRFFHLSYYTQL